MAEQEPPAFELPLEGLRDRFGLSPHQTEQLRRFAAILVHDDHVPTAVREPKRVRDDHLADALVALELPPIREAVMIADLGAGAGVPGIPLAVALPRAQVCLVEGNGRKCEFMAHTVALLGLPNAEVVHARAETWMPGLGRFDVVTARALAPLDVVAEYAAPLLRVGGVLVAWRGRREPRVEADGLRAADILGLSVAEPVKVEPYRGVEHRHLHVMSKVRETPDRFPRRDGVARKRPLGQM
jgi:16S rRNA (guanine527-N7)-methyltransferase